MKILVIGSGGREHALAWKLAQSPRVSEVLVAPGNAGTAREPKCRNVAVKATDIDGLAAQADALIEAAWSPAEAYEALCATSRLRSPGRVSPGQELSELLASLVQVVRADRGALVDVAASGTDVIVRAASGDEVPDDLPVVVAAARPREARRRCAVHGIRPRVVAMGDDWSLPGGSVVLAALPDDGDVLKAIEILGNGQEYARIVTEQDTPRK